MIGEYWAWVEALGPGTYFVVAIVILSITLLIAFIFEAIECKGRWAYFDGDSLMIGGAVGLVVGLLWAPLLFILPVAIVLGSAGLFTMWAVRKWDEKDRY